ncbi:glutathione S-transferase family protein [bacterium]|nr:glutathione S-transferase family protein [bacterium]
MSKNTIISFGLCPFVQRSLITMNHKGVDYDVKYIDLNDKPDWFLKISPLGKVPILQVEGQVLFESAVINEYIDETNGDSLHSKNALTKAKERAFIELSSAAIMSLYQTFMANEQEVYEAKKLDLEKHLSNILKEYQGPFFRGSDFSLVDTSVIPVIQRLFLTNNLLEDLNLKEEDNKKLKTWADATLNLQSVIDSVPENFASDYNQSLENAGSYIHLKK